MPEHPQITLGRHELPVYPQRHAYLTNRLASQLDALGAAGENLSDLAGAVEWLGQGTYGVLEAVIPNLGKRIPEWEFAGYGSQEAFDRGEYEEREDNSPTFPEILNAFEVAKEVNRFDVFAVLWRWVDPKVVKQRLNLFVATAGLSTSSPSSPGTNGESSPSDSGTTAPTSESSESPETTAPAESGSTPPTSA
jgi:hypothetical protein